MIFKGNILYKLVKILDIHSTANFYIYYVQTKTI